MKRSLARRQRDAAHSLLGRVGFFGHIAEPCTPAELKENPCPDEQDGEDDEGDTPAALPLGGLMPAECGASASLHALEGIGGLLAEGSASLDSAVATLALRFVSSRCSSSRSVSHLVFSSLEGADFLSEAVPFRRAHGRRGPIAIAAYDAR